MPPPLGEFSGQLGGRDGFIAYRESTKELKIYWEVSGSREFNVLVSPDFRNWPSVPPEPISEERQLQMLYALRDWLKGQNVRADIDLPSDTSEEEARCLWAGCPHPRLKQYYYCRRHYDLSCLSGGLARARQVV